VVLHIIMRLQQSTDKNGMKQALEHLAYRTKTQPQGHSIGCMFKNVDLAAGQIIKGVDLPEEFIQKKRISAGWLIDHAGMKGAVMGGAEVSTKHCNFILNRGHATTADVLALIDEIQTKVYDTFGVALEKEIQLI
jgi:UDP-N-acetylenolpyruvoylglucosamine reductase